MTIFAALPASLLAGPVAGAIAGGYASAASIVVTQHRGDRARAAGDVAAMEALAALTARLRAGADVATTAETIVPTLRRSGLVGPRLADRVAAARRVADATGARLADLLDRIEADARATARLRAFAAAEAGGVEATALLLAILPAGGVGLGAGVGADPVHMLLHTRLGGVCAGAAMALQAAGLAWARWLTRRTRESG